MVTDVIEGVVARYIAPEIFPEDWDLETLHGALLDIFPLRSSVADLRAIDDAVEASERILGEASEAYEQKEQEVTPEVMRELERMVLLSIIDNKWREHLYEMDYLQEGIHLRAYGQRDPLTEYQREAFSMFEELTESIRDEFARYIYRVELVRNDAPERPRPQQVAKNRTESSEVNTGQAPTARSDKVGRNAPCPCGSGRKYKKCHGATGATA